MFKAFCHLVRLAALGFGVSACGIKPGTVDPPPGTEGTKFPRTYPDPSTDPPQ